MRISDEGNDYISFLFCVMTVVLISMVVCLNISLLIWPPKAFDDWVSKPVTGWSNLNPMKMATYGQIEAEAGYDVKKKGKFQWT